MLWRCYDTCFFHCRSSPCTAQVSTLLRDSHCRPQIPMTPTFTSTEAQYSRAVRRVSAYISSTTQDVDARPNAHALYRFHPPGHPVRGTVILFHGLSTSPEIMAPTMNYLHQNGFNVYAPHIAGHAFHASRFPHTLLSPHLGSVQIRDIILQDDVLRTYFYHLTTLAAVAPPDMEEYAKISIRIHDLLREKLSPDHFKNVADALGFLSGDDYFPGFEATLAKYCESDHHRYESHPIERLCDVAALPGPISVIGYSLGALQTINLASRVNHIDKIVLISPYFRFLDIGSDQPSVVKLTALGALDLYELPIFGISARHITACTIAARLLHREEISEPVRRNVATFCILSDSDDACDSQVALAFCQEKIANRRTALFSYPKETDLKHTIYPNASNTFSVPLLQEIFRFLTTEKVQVDNMLKVDGDPSLPPVDRDTLQINA